MPAPQSGCEDQIKGRSPLTCSRQSVLPGADLRPPSAEDCTFSCYHIKHQQGSDDGELQKEIFVDFKRSEYFKDSLIHSFLDQLLDPSSVLSIAFNSSAP